MLASPPTLPHILTRPATRRLPPDLEDVNTRGMAAPSRFWQGKGKGQLRRDARQKALREALHDDAVAARIAAVLAEAQRWLRAIPNGIRLRDKLLPELLERLETDEQRQLCEEAPAHYATAFPKLPHLCHRRHNRDYVA